MTQDDRTHTRLPVKRRGFAAALLLGAAATVSLPVARTGLAAQPSSHGRVQATLNIGVKNFDEEYIIADMYQLLLQKAGFGVKQHVLGQTSILQTALLKGQIDLYPEYTGTGLVAVLKRKAIANPTRAYDVVKSQYQRRFNLTWLAQAPMNDTNSVAVTAATAGKYKLNNLSDLAKVASQLTFAALPDCKGRPDCEVGLANVYGIHFKSTRYVASTDLTIQALRSGQADAAEVFGTDGRIKAYGFKVLPDNKAAVFPADHIAPVVRTSVLNKYPQIRQVLNRVAPYITNKAITRLNAAYDIQHVDAMKLARQFLTSKHLL